MNPDLKIELLAAANASLQRHFARLDDEVQAAAAGFPPPSEETLADFTAHLQKSRRILGLFGAGLSASCGIPTYRGAGGFWRTYSDQQLATLGAFKSDPNVVWQFYEERRSGVLEAKPNAAHFALVRLAEAVPGFLSVNQNVDGMLYIIWSSSGRLSTANNSSRTVQKSRTSCGPDYQLPRIAPPRPLCGRCLRLCS